MKVLMVCLGNICRSPLAEGILASKVAQKGLDWEVDSAGTGDWHVGQKPDQRSIAVAQKYGIDLTQQRARQLKPADIKNFDLIFAMDSANYKNILDFTDTEEEAQKVILIRNLVHENQNLAVPDPYFGGDAGFEEVYHLLDEASDAIIARFG